MGFVYAFCLARGKRVHLLPRPVLFLSVDGLKEVLVWAKCSLWPKSGTSRVACLLQEDSDGRPFLLNPGFNPLVYFPKMSGEQVIWLLWPERSVGRTKDLNLNLAVSCVLNKRACERGGIERKMGYVLSCCLHCSHWMGCLCLCEPSACSFVLAGDLRACLAVQKQKMLEVFCSNRSGGGNHMLDLSRSLCG